MMSGLKVGLEQLSLNPSSSRTNSPPRVDDEVSLSALNSASSPTLWQQRTSAITPRMGASSKNSEEYQSSPPPHPVETSAPVAQAEALINLPPNIPSHSSQMKRIFKFFFTRLLMNVVVILPISALFLIYITAVLKHSVEDTAKLSFGLFSAVIGLTLFTESLRLSIMPLGKIVGQNLLLKAHAVPALLILGVFGVMITYAEPALDALMILVSLLEPTRAPYLYFLLHSWAEILVLFVGLGMGAAAILGTLRFMYSWSLKAIVVPITLLAVAFSIYMTWVNPELSEVIGLSWDIGSIVTGPVAIPCLLSLGMGIAQSMNKGTSNSDPLLAFGLVAIASLCPIIGVQLLAVLLSLVYKKEDIIRMNLVTSSLSQEESHETWQSRLIQQILYGARAILPSVTALLLLIFFMKLPLPIITVDDILMSRDNSSESVSLTPEPLHEQEISMSTESPTPPSDTIELQREEALHAPWYKRHLVLIVSIITVQIGIILFNYGIDFGFATLGAKTGLLLPSAILKTEKYGGPLYSADVGMFLVVLFLLVFALLATQAEPALYVFGLEVEILTQKKLPSRVLVLAVSLGVAVGIILGVMILLYGYFSILLIIFRLFALAQTIILPQAVVAVAWDSAGITTGPVTVPFVLSLGLGVASALQGQVSGFGVVTMISSMTIVVVMLCDSLYKIRKCTFKLTE